MTDDARALRLLVDLLDELPTVAPDGLLAAVLDEVRIAPQRHRWWSIRRDRTASARPTRRLAGGALLVAVVVATAIVVSGLAPNPAVVDPGSTSSPSPATASPTSAPPASSSPSAAVPSGSLRTPESLESIVNDGLFSGVPYTSDRFEPRVTFKLTGYGYRHGTYGDTDWCSALRTLGGATLEQRLPYTSSGSIVLGLRAPCVSHLRFIHPSAVDCGTPDAHPDAATLAAAVVTRLGAENVRDRGTLKNALWDGLFSGSYEGRVIDTVGGLMFDATSTDPDHCRLLPEAGSADPTIEIRGDMSSSMILLDLPGGLVVVRAESGGYDGPSGAAARARVPNPEDYLPYLLQGIYDIEFP